MSAVISAFVMSGCGSGGATAGGAAGTPGGVSAASVAPTRDVVSAIAKDEAIAALLPEQTRKAGTLNFGSSVGSAPAAFYPEGTNKVAIGVDIDIAAAVAKVLGLTVTREVAAFEGILPALGSGKYEIGTGNFGVTEARRKTIDFVTYINDGQGFAVRKDDEFSEIKDLKKLCGLVVGTGTGTTFEATLERNKQGCADSGQQPYEVKSFSDNGALYLALQQGRIRVVMSTINGLRYAVTQQPGLKFLNEFHRLDVGFALKKGSALAPALQAAVNKLIKDGTYRTILEKWGTQASAIPESLISPPEHQ